MRQFAHEFNLYSILRTLPVGIPSLLAGTMPLTNPFRFGGLGRIPEYHAVHGLVGCFDSHRMDRRRCVLQVDLET